jgi:beta-lactamase class A
VGDKTGTGANGSTNDIAVAWPPGRAPIFIAAYFTGSTIAQSERDAVLGEVGRIIASELAKRNH